MPQIAVVGADSLLARDLLIGLTARGNAAVAIGTPAESVREWKRDFGITSRMPPGDPADPAAWATTLDGCDAMVFCVGVGSPEGAAATGAIPRSVLPAIIEALRAAGIGRLISVSGHDASADEDSLVHASGCDWTILRFGRLLGGYGTNRVAIGESLPAADIPATDAASVVIAVLETPGTAGRAWFAAAGDSGARRATRALLALTPSAETSAGG